MSALREITAAEIRERLKEPAVFGHYVDLTRSIIKEPLDLSGHVLCGFDFSGSLFEREVRFENTTCKGISWFRGARFAAEVNFSSACFFNDARFDGAVFRSAASFRSAEFRGIATFDGCLAEAGLVFSDILANGNFSIAGAQLKERPQLSGAVLVGGFWHHGLPNDQFDGLDRCELFGRI